MPLEFNAPTLAALLVRAPSYSVLPILSNSLVASYILYNCHFALPKCSLTVLVAITLVIPT